MAFHGRRNLFLAKVLRQLHLVLSSQVKTSGSTQSHAVRLLWLSSVRYSSPSSTSTTSASPGYSSSTHKTESKQEKRRLKIAPQPPSGGTSDWIGPPDATSNIRPIKFHVPPNETETEKEFRLRREDTLQWNHKFWAEHNAKFFAEKDLFTQNLKGDDKRRKLSPEEMSIFYRKFLNDNREAHLQYNKEWYKRNISLLWPAFKVSVINLRRKLSRGESEGKK